MGEIRRILVDRVGERLDKFLAVKERDLSRSLIATLMSKGLVRVDGLVAKPSYRLKGGESVEMEVVSLGSDIPIAQDIHLSVNYEDKDMLVVDKPAGMVVHPAPGHYSDTLVNAILGRVPSIEQTGEKNRPGIVHRLDKDTSGLIVVAKNRIAHDYISSQIKNRSVHKGYIALVKGQVTPEQGIIKANIGRDRKNLKRMAVVDVGRDAETHYNVLEYFPQNTLVKVVPKTGRTHQIRVHFSALSHPLVGDKLYGGRDDKLERQFLHASVLGFRAPGNGEYMEFKSPLPSDLMLVLEELNAKCIESDLSQTL